MELKTFYAQDVNGNVIPSPTVYIYTKGTTTPIAGLEDENGDALANPFTGTADGLISVAAPDGEYDMRVTGSGRDTTLAVQFIDVTALAAAADASATAADASATASAASAAAAAEIVNISEVQTFTNPLQLASRVAMTAAASGSTGIQVLDNPQVNFGTGNFTLHWEGSLPDYTPSAGVRLFQKFSSLVGYELRLLTTGYLRVLINAGTYDSTATIQVADGSQILITAVITRESALSAGSVVFYVNGAQLGASVAITAASPVSTDTSVNLFFNGTNSERSACVWQNPIIYNRALTSAEVLSLCINGPALADVGASQVPYINQDYSTGLNGASASTGGVSVSAPVDAIAGADGWLRLEGDTANSRFTLTGATGVTWDSLFVRGAKLRFRFQVFIPNDSNVTQIYLARTSSGSGQRNFTIVSEAGDIGGVFSSPITTRGVIQTIDSVWTVGGLRSDVGSALTAWVYSSAGAGFVYIRVVQVNILGITAQYNAQDAQSNTGQLFDSSSNKNHALLPADGATVLPRRLSGEVRWTNTWAGTNELQYIGGVNQAILPANAYIESIIGTVSGATPHDIIIGDGSDTDRYVTITTGLAAGTTNFALAARTTGGTNLKLTVDPNTDATMSIAWVISYKTLEA